MKKLTIDDLKVEDKKVFVRVDFNVPLDKERQITDLTRIKAAIPTIKSLLERGAKVILASHLGRPNGKPDEKYSLRPVAIALEKELARPVRFCPTVIGEIAKTAIGQVGKGECIILENLRFYPAEEANDPEFCKEIASNIDLYVNDAFGTVHRAHASTEGIARIFSDAACGYLIGKELSALENFLNSPQQPITAIIGGAKVKDKILVLDKLLEKVDSLLIGGGMAYTFLQIQGKKIGNSLLDSEHLKETKAILKKAKTLNKQIFLPTDHLIATKFSEDSESKICSVDIPDNWMGMDIGEETIRVYRKEILKSNTVFWNGPMGVFEMKKFNRGTCEIAKAMAECPGQTIVGGGDSVSAVNQMKFGKKMTHISTGGGAFLEFIEGKVLPGIDAIKNLEK